jgi:hypothetical protein
VLTIGLIAVLPFAVLALLSFSRPPSARRPSETSYKQSGRLSYSASSTPGPTYANNVAVTGDPLFTRVVNKVNVRFEYQLSASAKESLAGTASLSANVASTSGWHTTLALGSSTHFRGNHATVTATLDLHSLFDLLDRVQTTTGMSTGYTLTLVPHVSTHGTIDSQPLHASFAPPVPFTVTALEVQPVVAGSSVAANATKPSTSPFTPSAAGTVKGTDYKPLYLSLAFARPTVATTRRIALGGIALVVLALLAILALPRPRRKSESTTIRSRYGRMIVQVDRVWQLPGVPVIDVADMDALARIAGHYDRSILHEIGAEGEAFWVTDESGQFRYAVGGWTGQVETTGAVDTTDAVDTMDAADAEPAPFESIGNEVYAEELSPVGEVSVTVADAQPTAEIIVTAPAVESEWAAAYDPTTHDAADAIVREWRAGWDSANVSRTASSPL